MEVEGNGRVVFAFVCKLLSWQQAAENRYGRGQIERRCKGRIGFGGEPEEFAAVEGRVVVVAFEWCGRGQGESAVLDELVAGVVACVDGVDVFDVVRDFFVDRAVGMLDAFDVNEVCNECLQKQKAHAKSDEFVQVLTGRESTQGTVLYY